MAATQGAQKLVKKAALLEKLLGRKESGETRIRLSEIWIDLNQRKNLLAARECLEVGLKKDVDKEAFLQCAHAVEAAGRREEELGGA